MSAVHEPSGAALGDTTDAFDVLVLTLDASAEPSVQLAILASAVREVFRVDRITPYPGAPVDVPGVTAVRGRIIAVLALAGRGDDGSAGAALVVVEVAGRAIALSGATPVRVAASAAHTDGGARPSVLLWSGRVLPLAGRVRLLDASRPDAADGAVLPLLDAAALIDDVIDDPDGE